MRGGRLGATSRDDAEGSDERDHADDSREDQQSAVFHSPTSFR
jgi:hypothetical protein